ncbi:helix-turn-helix domain-containing protein [Sphingobacterium humi]|uniref:Helix-turn-helix domain-containing protein n=1 Tax=Sphingobacterium humi TaxID=1796905 RepID=A0A6N8KZ77_9SPHI|nr:helix-turn-helix domain-containing protein [Sphingobacterium humi]MVZ62134.1 helix-turn-helix domain-containing protein [Sphingobacterium humi]
MSSNIQVTRICQHCNKEFIAKTTVTKFCSEFCGKRNYKLRQKQAKIARSEAETQEVRNVKSLPTSKDLSNKEFLSVTEVGKLIGCSRQNVYKLINTGKLNASNLLERKTIIKRSDIDKMLKDNEINNDRSQTLIVETTEYYSMQEIEVKYNMSEKAIYELIKRNNIEKVKRGRYSLVNKKDIDKLLS